MLGLPIQNKSNAINASVPLFEFFKLKEKDLTRRKINSKKIVYMRNQCFNHFDLPKIRVTRARTTKH